MLRRLFLITSILITSGLFFGAVGTQAATPVPTPKPVTTDQDCVAYNLLRPGNTLPTCNNTCEVEWVETGLHCTYGSTSDPNGSIPGECALDPISNFFKFSGVVIPPDKVVAYLSRVILMGLYSLAGLLSIIYGIYGVVKRSVSEGNPDKVADAMKILKNAIIGLLMVFMAVVVVQIASSLLGVSASPFDFSLVPPGTVGECVTRGPTPTP